jgi:hypothetical protein
MREIAVFRATGRRPRERRLESIARNIRKLLKKAVHPYYA